MKKEITMELLLRENFTEPKDLKRSLKKLKLSPYIVKERTEIVDFPDTDFDSGILIAKIFYLEMVIRIYKSSEGHVAIFSKNSKNQQNLEPIKRYIKRQRLKTMILSSVQFLNSHFPTYIEKYKGYRIYIQQIWGKRKWRYIYSNAHCDTYRSILSNSKVGAVKKAKNEIDEDQAFKSRLSGKN